MGQALRLFVVHPEKSSGLFKPVDSLGPGLDSLTSCGHREP
jgi:hypothetical protein